MSLTIIRHIVPENWMRKDPIRNIFAALQGDASPQDHKALLVGGCVRNILLGKQVDDIDIATPLSPGEVTKRLQKAGIKVIPTGIDHGTVTAVHGDETFEITSLRTDKNTDGRHAQVEFTNNWVEDARRRDFTINTLLMDLLGNIYDPLGQGMYDIKNKKVRFVGVPDQRIKEDYLRILRFFRFSAIYADDFDVHAVAACKANAEGIDNLSKERITQEFFKIILSDHPLDALNIMFENNILASLMCKDFDCKTFSALCRFQKNYRLHSLSSRLFAFAGLNFDHIKKMEEYIIFPKVIIKDMRSLNGSMNFGALSSDGAVRRSIYRFGRVATAQALLFDLAQDRVMNSFAPHALTIIQNWEIPNFPLSGNDLIAAGIKKGPELGKALEALENKWIESDFQCQKPELLTSALS